MRQLLIVTALLLVSPSVHALDLDWSGQFRTESHVLLAPTSDHGNINADPARTGMGGYYSPGSGEANAYFQTLFLRLRPSIIVNDNIYIKSEWWVGDPIFGFFGSGAPYPAEQRLYSSTQARGSSITAQRYWGEFLSEIGTVQAGRIPLNYGLGIVWNSGDGIWDRYMSTGDGVRLLSRFGAFTVSPAFIKYSAGNNIGGSCPDPTGGTCAALAGSGGVTDYSFMLEYDNTDEDMKLGLNFVRRLSGASQDSTGRGYLGPSGSPSGATYNTWDIYVRKDFGRFSIAGELPVAAGTLGGSKYTTYALALESKWQPTDMWETALKVGHAPGQPNGDSVDPTTYRAFYFHPNYRLGLIMFNYQPSHLAGPNTLNNPATPESSLKSPFDNPIVNANYASWTGAFNTGKWQFKTQWIIAAARYAAVSGKFFHNTWESRMRSGTGGIKDQEKFLGWEMDYGTRYKWDDALEFNFDFGWWFPGGYYAYSNTSIPNGISPVFAANLRVGVLF